MGIGAKKKTFLIWSILIFTLINQFLVKNLYSLETAKIEVVLSITINGEKKGDLFCFIKDKEIYLPLEDFLLLGFKEVKGEKLKINNKDYLLLNSWKDVVFKFNEDKLELDIVVPPKYLPENTISLYPKKRTNVIIPNQNSIFLNYRFDYTDIEHLSDFFVNHELGIRFKDFSIISDGFYFDETNKYTRLNTTLYYDNRNDLTRLAIGDFLTPSSPTGSGYNMAGISYFRNFNLDPYFIYKPTFNISTYATFRSEVEIYLDNTLIRKEFVPPGGLNLSDLYYYGGRKDVKVIIKDPFGRLETFSYPFYFTDIMLKKGLREFNYSLGFLRKNYSVESNNYTDLAFVAMERYGYSDYVNIGGRIEGVPSYDYYNIAGEAILLLKKYGVISFIPSFSTNNGNTGTALISAYNFQEKNYSIRLTSFLSSDDYNGSIYKNADTIKRSFSIGGSYYLFSIGSFSLDFVHNKYQSSEKNSINFGYSKSIKGNISFYANLTKRYGNPNATEFFAGISIYPKKDYTLSARYEDTEGRTAEVLQLSKSAPTGEGYGYRLTLEREKTISTANVVNPYLQYRIPYGVFEADALIKERSDKTYENYRFSYAGAIAYAGDKLGFTRPINDSFALIKTGDIKDVRVSLNGQFIGKTNKEGYIFLPDLNSYYDNIITINDKDIPFEYDILTKELAVSPWYKSGFCLEFPVDRVYRYSGILKGNFGDEIKPLEYFEITIERKEKEEKKSRCMKIKTPSEEKFIKVPTGKGGEFYIENLEPGVYKAEIAINDKPIEFFIVAQDKKEFIIDLGEITLPVSYASKSKETVASENLEKPALTSTKEDMKKYEIEEDVKRLEDFIKKYEFTHFFDHTVYFKFDSTSFTSDREKES
ncbi:MAG: fimbrial biogenesis outer membrane usher protein [bacterium]